jgi:hypothetical protein
MARVKVMCLCILLVFAFSSISFAMNEYRVSAPPPLVSTARVLSNEPYILSSSGDTTWLRVHTDTTYCPGDPNWRRGGEATGGPGPLETWCFEQGVGDSCGTYPPWDTRCFTHVDVRKQPSPTNINFWHIDPYRTDQRPYCGDYALWCGSDSLWIDGYPVDCGTWVNPPGYANQWNCYAQLSLPDSFGVANGCTLLFDPRYDIECKYDYFYVDFWDGTQWNTLATFNATSNNPGAICGYSGSPNPDYWSNTDTDHMLNCDWQERFDPDLPAFYYVITPDTLVIAEGPMFRWRVTSDGAWSDQDGRGESDGAAFIDNVWVWGDSERYAEDFESGQLDTAYWSLPDGDGMVDHWHIAFAPPVKYGFFGCIVESSWVYRGRPDSGYSPPYKNAWCYRLMSPRIPIQSSGCVFQWDAYMCKLDYTCDYMNDHVRLYSSTHNKWCPWIAMDYPWYYSCTWSYDLDTHVTPFISPDVDSVQLSWYLIDVGTPNDFCWGKHKSTDFQIDNVSVGFYDAHATRIYARTIDLLHDTFYTGICGYNSHFKAYNPDTVAHYTGPGAPALPKYKQLYVEATDPDSITAIELYGSIDEGASWVSVSMTVAQYHDPARPWEGGEYYGTLCPEDFSLSAWPKGTVVWYYVKATDGLANQEYFPDRANPSHPLHESSSGDYLTFTVLPRYPVTYEGPKVLLVDGYDRQNYDYSPCLSRLDNVVKLGKIYEQVLTDAGYCYDKYDILGSGSYVQIQCIWLDDYDAVVWFTGPYFSNYLFHKQAQEAIRDYLASRGNVIICGDRIAYDMAPESEGGVGEDSLDGDFLEGVLGTDYIGEMSGGRDYPYIYAVGVDTVNVFGNPVEIDLDTLLVYRECPYLKDMSNIAVIDSPPAGYTAQRLMYISNPEIAAADEVIYTEYLGLGQCAFVNFDLCASVNHETDYCSGGTPAPVPDFTGGTYTGRVELIRTIMEDIFGIPSSASGGPADIVGPVTVYQWALGQNLPNPCVASTAIRYTVASHAHVEIKVYNALGQMVRVLTDGVKEPGVHTVHWDGCNVRGDRVSSGVYFYQIEAGPFSATRKMLVLR